MTRYKSLPSNFCPGQAPRASRSFSACASFLGNALRNKALTRDRDFNPILSAMTSSVGIS